MLSFMRRLAGDQRGVTAVEYALIVCLISCVAIGAMATLGQTLFNTAGPVVTALR
jgi:Flp pilus assembly pilin Flp